MDNAKLVKLNVVILSIITMRGGMAEKIDGYNIVVVNVSLKQLTDLFLKITYFLFAFLKKYSGILKFLRGACVQVITV